MKFNYSREWLQRHLVVELDSTVEAGKKLEPDAAQGKSNVVTLSGRVSAITERNQVQMRVALGTLVRQLRSRDALTLAALAEKADISEEELRSVENNPTYTAGPRLLFQLSKFFGVNLNNLYQLSGETVAVDRRLYNRAVKYAAHSADVSPLTPLQRAELDMFVEVLNSAEAVARE